MNGFLRIIAGFAVVGIAIIAILLVIDVVDTVETKELLTKVLLVLGIVAFGGIVMSFVSGPSNNSKSDQSK